MKPKILFIIFIALITAFLVQTYVVVQQKASTKQQAVEITFLDIGQGDATFIEFQNGQQMLVDCAIDARILEALGRVMPFYDHSIDYLVVTHPDLDHYGGCIDVMERFDIGTIVYTGAEKSGGLFMEFAKYMAEESAEYIIADGQRFVIASTTVDVLYPKGEMLFDEPNNTSIILNVQHAGTSVLLTGDAEKELEQYLVDSDADIDVDILKGGHHGSNSSSIEPFLEKTSPQHVIFSAGIDNRYHHPSERVLKRVERFGATIWRTDTQGDILTTITDNGMYVSSQK